MITSPRSVIVLSATLVTLVSVQRPNPSRAALATTIDLALVSPTATLTGGYGFGWGGKSICIADINGDDWPDIVVASCLAEPLGGLRQGELTIVWGAYPGLTGVVPLSSPNGMSHILGPSDGDAVYCDVAAADINADGFADILWGHPNGSSEASGKVYVIPGREVFPAVIDLENPGAEISIVRGHERFGWLGYQIEGADFNGDGIDDLVMSAPRVLHSEIYVIAGSASLLPAYWTGSDQPGMTRIIDVQEDGELGISIAADDLDEDGKDDLLIGGRGPGGRAIILHGMPASSDTLLTSDSALRAKMILPEFPDGQLGQDVAIGDVDNDGVLDIAVASVSADPLGCDGCGAVYLIRDANQMPDTVCLQDTGYPITRLIGAGSFTYYGLHLAFGDMDGDHRDDLAVSNLPVLENQRARTVIAFASALTSSTHLLASDPAFTRIIEKKIGDSLGSSLAAADLNRDGLDDLLIGAFQADPPQFGNGGEVYLVNGCQVPSATPSVTPAFSIQQNYPNPFNPTTAIGYTLPRRVRVRIDLFDATGKSIATLVDAVQDAGDHVARWDGRDDKGQGAASGVYFCRITAEELSASVKLVLLR